MDSTQPSPPAPPPARFRPSELEQAIVAVIRRGQSSWQPDLYEVCLNERVMVWKDMSRRPWIFRRIFGAVLRREARALQALGGFPGAPRLLGLAGRDGFVMERLEGQRLPHLKDNDLPPAFFDALLRALRAMHAAGVAHGDLRRKNVLVEPGAPPRPRLIDFGTAIVLGPRPGPIRKALWRRARRIDLLHYAKLKEHYLPGSLTPEEKRWLAYAPWFYRLGRLYRARIHRPLKWRNLRKTLRAWGLLGPKR